MKRWCPRAGRLAMRARFQGYVGGIPAALDTLGRMTIRGISILAAAATVIAVGFPAPSAQAAPADDPPTCSHLIAMRDAYYDLYSRTKSDNSLLVVVAQ